MNVLNPKAAVFYIAAVPGFADADEPITQQLVTFTLISVLIATYVHTLLVLLASHFLRFFQHPSRQRRCRRLMAVLLVLVALWFGVSMGRSPS